jgi:hypothetical protein
LVQAKDIPDEMIVAAVRATRGRNGVPAWATTWDIFEYLSAYPEAVVRAKLRSCVRRKIIGGHVCGNHKADCRGDFELLDGT